MLRSSEDSPLSEQTAISPVLRALEQSKLGRPGNFVSGPGCTVADCDAATLPAGCSAVTSLDSTAGGDGGCSIRLNVSSGVMIASALRKATPPVASTE